MANLNSLVTISILDSNVFVKIFIVLSVVFGILLISSKDPMVSIIYLILLFISVSGFLYSIGLYVMSLLYILIYVGAISILFLFVLSLLDEKYTVLKVSNSNYDVPFGVILGGVQMYYIDKWLLESAEENSVYLGFRNVIFGNGEASDLNIGGTETLLDTLNFGWFDIGGIKSLSTLGNILFTEQACFLVAIGIILLLSIIGLIVLFNFRRVPALRDLFLMLHRRNKK